ncbi:MAG: SUF system NifU family Fe-S cluster assembly protein [Bacteroidia bacterium]|nr:SUF system NifU family Fe-S cluster assembly protein [Bacteroidia bacterium]
MTPELQRLYQDILLEHNQYPRNYGRLSEPTHEAEGYNPLCGDQVHLTLRVEGDRVTDVKFEGKSCAICKASSSILTTLVKGSSISEADALFTAFHELLTQEDTPSLNSLSPAAQEKLRIFSTVRLFPIRVKCATLPWHTLRTALHDPTRKTVTTE